MTDTAPKPKAKPKAKSETVEVTVTEQGAGRVHKGDGTRAKFNDQLEAPRSSAAKLVAAGLVVMGAQKLDPVPTDDD